MRGLFRCPGSLLTVPTSTSHILVQRSAACVAFVSSMHVLFWRTAQPPRNGELGGQCGEPFEMPRHSRSRRLSGLGTRPA
jgi:hypothetical protein